MFNTEKFIEGLKQDVAAKIERATQKEINEAGAILRKYLTRDQQPVAGLKITGVLIDFLEDAVNQDLGRDVIERHTDHLKNLVSGTLNRTGALEVACDIVDLYRFELIETREKMEREAEYAHAIRDHGYVELTVVK